MKNLIQSQRDFFNSNQSKSVFKYFLIINIFIFTHNTVYAQHGNINFSNVNDLVAHKSELIITECAGTANPNYNSPPLLTNIKNVTKKFIYSPEIDELKFNKTASKLIEDSSKGNVILNSNINSNNFLLANNFQANIFNGGAPPDNSIAIANNGNIVSVINCNVAYYTNKGVRKWIGSFWELYKDSTLTELIFDPIVLYDSQQDRFVMIAVHGFTPNTSKLIISFSKTNNPMDGWWFYKLSGNPLNNSCWLDYPKIGISKNEIFVTGNLFNDLTGFRESVIYQISKGNGFSGTNLSWKLWSNISGSPNIIIPVSNGQYGNYGPGFYFLNQSPGSGNSVNLYEITNEIDSNPQLTKKTIFKFDYEPSGNALQLGTTVQLITADCRILNAFYLDSIIHYVFQSDFQNTNYSGINYNQLNVKTLTNVSYNYGEIGFDCAFPSVASFSTSTNDKSVVFCFLRSGATIFPETRAIIFNNNKTWSNPILVKSGNTFVDAYKNNNTVRWGDYTGIAYKYNPDKAEVWLSGCYGSNQMLNNINYKCFNNWIAQIGGGTLSNVEDISSNQILFNVFPNPTVDLFNLEFNIVETCKINIDVLDINGKMLFKLYDGYLKNGTNLLTFNRAYLSKGVYFIRINGDKINHLNKLIVD